MNTQDYIRHEFGQGHQILQGILKDTPDDVLNHIPAGGNLGSAASILSHLIYDEDMILSGVAGKPMLWESAGWKDKTGVAIPGPMQAAEWTSKVRITPQFREYAEAVFANTDAVVAGLADDHMEKEMQGPFGPTTAAKMLALGVYHLAGHSGEIAALKGVQGVKGLPF
jgi:hypothetical protein